MHQWLADTFGDQNALILFYAIIVIVIIFTLWLLRKVWRAMHGGTFVQGGRNRKHRLAIMDATPVDNRRRLVLVRRDDVEHLILIGGMNDVVIERDIHLANERTSDNREKIPPIAQTAINQPKPRPVEPRKETIPAAAAAVVGTVAAVSAVPVANKVQQTTASRPEPNLAATPTPAARVEIAETIKPSEPIRQRDVSSAAVQPEKHNIQASKTEPAATPQRNQPVVAGENKVSDKREPNLDDIELADTIEGEMENLLNSLTGADRN